MATLKGTKKADMLIGEMLEDNKISGKAGNDDLTGGDMVDKIYGGKGDDQAFGNDGDDRLYGENGDDYLSGSFGDDYLSGGKGKDSLDGGNGDDVLKGGKGNDWLSGGAGDGDQLWGGAGKDTFFITQSYEDTVMDFSVKKDKIELDNHIDADSFDEVIALFSQDGDDAVLEWGGINVLTLRNVDMDDLSAKNFIFD